MMEQLAKDPWFQAIGTLQVLAGIGALLLLFARWRRTGLVLRFEPRCPVPWGAAGALLALVFTAAAISSAFGHVDAPVKVQGPRPQQIMLSLATSMVMQSLAPVLLLLIAASSNAGRGDIGLPAPSAAAWARDIKIGIVACLAAIIPVGFVNAASRLFLKLPNELTKHPLVEMLTNSAPEITVLLLATVMVVIVAPVAEEITYRLLLQGWLEKWEDRRLGWRTPPPATDTAHTMLEPQEPPVAADPLADEPPIELVPIAPEPPKRGVAGLPYGWTPILISSLLFAAAHYGYGPEPVPLFVLALVLGYCYQRTHRIIPSIVAHGLFNLLSMLALWRVVLLAAP